MPVLLNEAELERSAVRRATQISTQRQSAWPAEDGYGRNEGIRTHGDELSVRQERPADRKDLLRKHRIGRPHPPGQHQRSDQLRKQSDRA